MKRYYKLIICVMQILCNANFDRLIQSNKNTGYISVRFSIQTRQGNEEF